MYKAFRGNNAPDTVGDPSPTINPAITAVVQAVRFKAAFAEHREGEGREGLCFNGGAVSRGVGRLCKKTGGGRRRQRRRLHQQCRAWGGLGV